MVGQLVRVLKNREGENPTEILSVSQNGTVRHKTGQKSCHLFLLENETTLKPVTVVITFSKFDQKHGFFPTFMALHFRLTVN